MKYMQKERCESAGAGQHLLNGQTAAPQQLSGHITPARDSLVYDSLELPPEGQAFGGSAGTSARAFWFNSTPRETQEPPKTADSPQQPAAHLDLAGEDDTADAPGPLPEEQAEEFAVAASSAEQRGADSSLETQAALKEIGTKIETREAEASAEPETPAVLAETDSNTKAEAAGAAETQAVLKEAVPNAEAAGKPSGAQKQDQCPAASLHAGKENDCMTPLSEAKSIGKASTGKRTADGNKSGCVLCHFVRLYLCRYRQRRFCAHGAISTC